MPFFIVTFKLECVSQTAIGGPLIFQFLVDKEVGVICADCVLI